MKHNLIEIEQLYLSDKDANLEGEVKLWRAVINLALEDLSLPTSNERYRLWRKQAVDWFINVDGEFNLVCELAQVSVEHILSMAYSRISKP
jgi:hypothetical protein